MTKEKKKRQTTWGGLMIARAGLMKAARAMTFVSCWAMVEMDLGHEPTVEEYSVWWSQSSRTTYRDLAAFRECLPEFRTPTGFLAVAGSPAFAERVPGDFAGGTA